MVYWFVLVIILIQVCTAWGAELGLESTVLPASFPYAAPHVEYPSNLMLDGKSLVLTPAAEGSKTPTATLPALTTGVHTLDPGGHQFTVNSDGSIISGDADITVKGERLTLHVYPLNMETINLSISPTIRPDLRRVDWLWPFISWKNSQVWNWNGWSAGTVYLPSSGKDPYVIRLGNLESARVQLSAVGVELLPDELKPIDNTPGPQLSGTILSLPVWVWPVQVRASAADPEGFMRMWPYGPPGWARFDFAVGRGGGEIFSIMPDISKTRDEKSQNYPHKGVPLLRVAGDLATFPCRAYAVDASDPYAFEPRALEWAMQTDRMESGAGILYRVQLHDATDHKWKEPTVGVWLDNGNETPRRLTVVPVKDGIASGEISFTDVLPGNYWLIIAGGEGTMLSMETPLRTSMPVSIISHSATATAFTGADRGTFLQGEDVEVSVALSADSVVPESLLFLNIKDGLDYSTTIAKSNVPSLKAGERRTLTFRIPGEFTARLGPGDYELMPSWENSHVFSLIIRIGSRRAGDGPPSWAYWWGPIAGPFAFPNKEFPDKKGFGALGRSGYNLYTSDWLGPDYRPGKGPERRPGRWFWQNSPGRLLPEKPFGEEQSPYYPMVSESASAGLDTGIRIIPHIYMSDSPPLEPIDPWIISTENRRIHIQWQGLRRFPNVLGVQYTGWWSMLLAPGGFASPPQGQLPVEWFDKRNLLLSAEFEKRYGIKPDAPEKPQDLWHSPDFNKRLAWARFLNEIAALPRERFGEKIHEISPVVALGDLMPLVAETSPSIAQSQFFGSGAYNPITKRPLNYIPNVMVPEWGLSPWEGSFAGVIGRFFRDTNRPFWSQPSPHNTFSVDGALRQGFQAILTGGWLSGWSWGREVSADRFHSSGTGARERWWNELLRRIGPVTMQWENQKRVALYISFEQITDPNFLVPDGHSAISMDAFYTMLLGHEPPAILFNEDLEAGRLQEYEFLLVTRQTVSLPETIEKALERFIASGGKIFTDGETTVPISGAIKLDITFKDVLTFAQKKSWSVMVPKLAKGFITREAALYEILKPKSQKLLDAMGLTPIVEPSVGRVLTGLHQAGEAHYLILANSQWPPFVTDWHEGFNMPRIPELFFSTYTLPLQTEVRLAPQYEGWVLYNLLTRRKVEYTERRFTADLTRQPGGLYLLLPQPIKQVEMKCSGSAELGEQVKVEVQVLGANGKPVHGVLSLEVELLDDTGAMIARRTIATKINGMAVATTMLLPLNGKPGKYQVHVTEGASGKTVLAALLVKPASCTPPIVSPLSDVIVCDGRAIAGAFAAREEWVIVLDNQPHLKDLAERLAASLRVHGLHISICDLTDYLDRTPLQPPKAEGYTMPDIIIPDKIKALAPDMFGLKRNPALLDPIILLGCYGENRLLDMFLDTDIHLRRFSPEYPGTGKALIEHLWSAVQGDQPTITVVSEDKNGLNKGVEKLLTIVAGKVSEEDDPAASVERARHEQLPDDLATELKVGSEELPLNPMAPVSNAQLIEGRDADRQIATLHQLGEAVSDLSVHRDQVAVGLDSYYLNIMKLSKDGKTKMRGHAKEMWPSRVRLLADGSVAVTTNFPGLLQVLNADGKVTWTQPIAWNRYSWIESQSFDTSPDGKSIYVFVPNQELACYDAITHVERWRYKFNPDDVNLDTQPLSVTSSPAGDVIVLGLWTLSDEEKPPENLKSQLGGRLVFLKNDGSLIREAKGHFAPYTFQFSPLAGQLTSYHHEGGDGISRYHSEIPKRWSPRGALGTRVVFSPTGKFVVAADEVGDILVLRPDGSEVAWLPVTARPMTHTVAEPRVSDDGRTVVFFMAHCIPQSPVNTGPLYRWDVETGRITRLVDEEPFMVSDAQFAEDGRLAVGVWDGAVRAFSPDGSEEWRTTVVGGPRLVWLSNGELLAGTGLGHLVRLTADGKVLWSLDLTSTSYEPEIWSEKLKMTEP